MKDTSSCIETENKRIEELNNSFWLRESAEGLSQKVSAYVKCEKLREDNVIGRHDLKKITRLQALEEHKNGTEFSPQALDKLGVK